MEIDLAQSPYIDVMTERDSADTLRKMGRNTDAAVTPATCGSRTTAPPLWPSSPTIRICSPAQATATAPSSLPRASLRALPDQPSSPTTESSAVSLFGVGGSALTSSPVTGGGLDMPAAVAIDGQGMAWVANPQTAGSISQPNVTAGSALSPAAGLGVVNQPQAIAIDASGSVWTANAGDNSVSMIVGLAAPVPTPLVMHAGP